MLMSIWSWSVYSSIDPLVMYLTPALHSVQYLYFVWLMKRNEAREEEAPPRFGRPVGTRLAVLAVSATGLAWLLFHGAPGILDDALTRGLRRKGSCRAELRGARRAGSSRSAKCRLYRKLHRPQTASPARLPA